jgi:hypothetical protein
MAPRAYWKGYLNPIALSSRRERLPHFLCNGGGHGGLRFVLENVWAEIGRPFRRRIGGQSADDSRQHWFKWVFRPSIGGGAGLIRG